MIFFYVLFIFMKYNQNCYLNRNWSIIGLIYLKCVTVAINFFITNAGFSKWKEGKKLEKILILNVQKFSFKIKDAKIHRFAPINITDPEGGVDLGKNLNKNFIPTKLAAHLVSFTVYSLLLITHSSEFHQKKIRSSWMKSKITCTCVTE